MSGVRESSNANGLTVGVWRMFFDTRAIGMAILAISILTPFVPVEPGVAIVLMGLGVPVSLAMRSAIHLIEPRSWLVVIVDTVLICLAISVDPTVAPAGGVLLLAAASLTAASGWRATVVAALATAPLVIVVLDRYAAETMLPIVMTYLVCAVGVSWFVSSIAQNANEERLDRDRLVEGLDAIVWEAKPYPFVDATLSGRTEDLLGFEPHELSGPGGWLVRLPALDRARVVAESQRLIDRGEDHEVTYRITAADGELRHVRDRVRVETDANGKPTVARGIVVDITDEVRVRETNRNLAELVERVKVGLVVCRHHEVLGHRTFTTLSVNQAYEDLTGKPATHLINVDTIEPIDGEARQPLAHVLHETAATGRAQRIDEAGDLRAEGRKVVSLEAFPISDSLIGLNVADVTERVTTADALRHQALHDALTGLPNRALLEDRLRHAVAAASRDDSSVGLLMLDLNQFKDVNDTLGHDQGDRLLQLVAHRLRDAMRGGDTVARLGGDEFAVLLTDEVSPRRILRAAERVLQCFEEPLDVDGMALQCGGSLGVSIFPDHGRSADELRKHADIAMYVAKRRGGGLAVYDPVRDQPDRDRLTLVSQLRHAIDGEGLELHYQPAVDLATGSVQRVEALVRWFHPERGPIPPIDFIDLAEVSGLIKPLTRWAVSRALRDLAAFRADDFDLGVSINVSVRNLYEPQFVDGIAAMLAAYGVDGRHVTLELTETQVMDDPTLAHSVLGRLGELGVSSSVDDFGTGHSSLSNLQSLPVSEVKIDRSFVQAMTDNDEAAAAIVRSIVSLGHNLGLDVVAEGVETNDALTALSLLGCDRAQGYLFAKPMPADELRTYLVETRQGVSPNPG